MLIPLQSFLNRVFPLSKYEDIKDNIVLKRLFSPRKDCVGIELTSPINWEAESMIQDRNWRMQLQGWAMFFPIMNFFDSYPNKDKIVEYFFDVARDWYLNYGSDANDIVTSRMPKSYAWYDMSVGFRALVIAFFWNRIVENNIEMADEDRALLNKIVNKHISHLANKNVFSLNNHGIFQIQGLMALVQLSGVNEYYDEYKYCLEKMVELILAQYNHQGIHLENSPHYHFYALNAFKNVVYSGWYADEIIIQNIVKKAESAKKWLVDPNKRPAAIGDSILTEQKLNFGLDEMTEVLEINKEIGLISNFSESGYQIFRSHWNVDPNLSTYLFLMGMYHTKSHKHRDCLSFEWFEHGEKIVCDSGKYGYISDKYRNYFLSYRAHNTVEIEDFDILKISPYGSCINSADEKNGKIYFSGSLNYPAVKFGRELILNPGKWLIVKDNLDFSRRRDIIQWFHFDKSYALVSSNENRLVFEKNNLRLIVKNLDPNYKTQIHYGNSETLQGFISEKDFSFESNYSIGFKKEKIVKDECISLLALSIEDEVDALNFISTNKSKSEINNTSINQPTPKYLINSIRHINREVNSHRLDLLPEKNTYSYVVNGIKLHFFANIKAQDEKITIMLPGAVNRDKTLYNFQRFSWSDDIDGSVIIFLDPTVVAENDLTIGWFQGDCDHYAIPILESFIKSLLKNNNYKEQDLTLFGSSAGGFTCLKLANSFIESTVKVINPQTIIYNYSAQAVDKLLSWILPCNNGKLTKENKDRLKIQLELEKRKKPIFYYQNKDDGHHFIKHLRPLLNTLDASLYSITELQEKHINNEFMLNIIYYSDEEKGHSPPNKKDTLELLNM